MTQPVEPVGTGPGPGATIILLCTSCGNQSTPDEEFCPSCGTYLDWHGETMSLPAPDPEPVSVVVPEAPPPEPEPAPPPPAESLPQWLWNAVRLTPRPDPLPPATV
ncbi:MAG: hypothetical protein ACRDYV_03675, partial [Acidimicrobiia bacterium]